MLNLARAGGRCLARAVAAAGPVRASAPLSSGALERALTHMPTGAPANIPQRMACVMGRFSTAASAPLSDQPAPAVPGVSASSEDWARHVQDLKAAADGLAPPDLAAPAVVPVINYARETVGEVELPADIFQKEIRRDILQRVVRWQLAKRQQGTHSVKGRGQVRGGGKKPHPQKKTGNARAGSIRSPLWRGGGVTHGPVSRSHAIGLPKKVRRLGLKVALSAKASEGRLIILDSADMERGKTKIMAGQLEDLLADAPRRSILFLDSGKTAEDGGESLRRSISNLPWVDALPQEGANVYSILQRDYLAITEAALQRLIIRLRTPINR